MPSRILPSRPGRQLLPRRPPYSFTSYDTNISGGGALTTVNSGASAHTKNTTYTQLIASTTADTYWIEIFGSNVFIANTDTGLLCDIATGAAASEVVVIANLNFGHATTFTAGNLSGGQRYAFPLFIPAGTRVSATAQGVQTSDTVDIGITLYQSPERPIWTGTSVTTYGADTANSQGVSVTSASAGEGTYTQITAATTADHQFLAVGVAGLDGTITSNTTYALDLGIGPATETNIAENFLFAATSSENITMTRPFYVWRFVPSGTRLAARIQAGTGTDNFDVIVYGVSG